jgi:hypothetical protein
VDVAAIASVALTMKEMSGSLVLLSGVGTHTITASAEAMTDSSVDAVSLPSATRGARTAVGMSSMYDSPFLSSVTLRSSLSYPVTWKPALANSTTSGSPTYPMPTSVREFL